MELFDIRGLSGGAKAVDGVKSLVLIIYTGVNKLSGRL